MKARKTLLLALLTLFLSAHLYADSPIPPPLTDLNESPILVPWEAYKNALWYYDVYPVMNKALEDSRDMLDTFAIRAIEAEKKVAFWKGAGIGIGAVWAITFIVDLLFILFGG